MVNVTEIRWPAEWRNPTYGDWIRQTHFPSLEAAQESIHEQIKDASMNGSVPLVWRVVKVERTVVAVFQ